MTFIITFDFDKTISRISIPVSILLAQGNWDSSKFDKSIDYIIKKLGINNVISKAFLHPVFINYLRRLKSKYRAKIIISSFGLNDAIRVMLKKLNISDVFDEIITPGNMGKSDGHEYFSELDGKNMMMTSVQKKYGIPNNRVILVDDDIRNIKRALNNGYKVSFVPDRRGIKLENIVDIKKFVDGVKQTC